MYVISLAARSRTPTLGPVPKQKIYFATKGKGRPYPSCILPFYTMPMNLCCAPGSWSEMSDSNPGPRSPKSGAQPMSHHIPYESPQLHKRRNLQETQLLREPSHLKWANSSSTSHHISMSQQDCMSHQISSKPPHLLYEPPHLNESPHFQEPPHPSEPAELYEPPHLREPT